MKLISNSRLNRLIDSWLYIPSKKKNAKFRLFCFHYAGASAEIFHSWDNYISPDIEICSIQMPGRSKRTSEPFASDIWQVVQEITDVIIAYNTLPYCFFGHSMGGLIAYEVVRNLQKNSYHLPSTLFLSAIRPPCLDYIKEELHVLPTDYFVQMINKVNESADCNFSEKNIEDFLPMIVSDFKIVDKWDSPKKNERVKSRIQAYGGTDDEYVLEEHLSEWSKYTFVNFNLTIFQGDHFFIRNDNIKKQIITDIENSFKHDKFR